MHRCSQGFCMLTDQETLSKNNDTQGNYFQAPVSRREKNISGHWSLFSMPEFMLHEEMTGFNT